MTGRRRSAGSNHIAEWFGHRTYPDISTDPSALSDQKSEHCPFISVVTGETHKCVKSKNSRGVCTISSYSNGPRQDWLVCPFRALDLALIEDAVRRMYGFPAEDEIELIAATVLTDPDRRQAMLDAVDRGVPVVVYFQNKLGGEISIGATQKSPEFSFDATVVELVPTEDDLFEPGRYGIIEIQTMDFHGTYSAATQNLTQALRLHGDEFADAVRAHPEWLSEKVEGPNISNVFKRTFYQMMFKFQIGAHSASAGCVLAVPKSVWDSWQRHLAAPELVERPDGTWQLGSNDPTLRTTGRPPAWIYVFDVDSSSKSTPNMLAIWRVIATDAPSMSYYALDAAPEAALAEGGAVDRLAITIHKRLIPLLGDVLAPMN